jgi:T1SS-143 domain-containing protein
MPSPINLSEEGLTGGIADTTGISDTTNATVFSGNLAITDVDSSSFTINLTAPAAALTSGGVAVTWTGGVGGAPLVGSAGGDEVIRLQVSNTGAYTVTLSGPVDHATAGVEDVRSLAFGVSVSDGLSPAATTTLTVNIEDDSPFMGSQHQAVTLLPQDTNLMIMLDVSGSMNDTVTVSGVQMTKLAAAIQAINTLLDTYDAFGNVAVRLVTFSTNANPHGAVWETVASAKAFLATLTANGWTNYDAALADGMAAFANSGKIAGAQNVSYFLSDGDPTYSNNNINTLTDTNATGNNNADEGIQAAEEAIWRNFLSTNDITSFAMGMGTAVNVAQLNPIAYNGATDTDTNGMVVTNWSALSASLAATVAAPTSGQILSGNALGENWGVGADDGYLQSVGVDGQTYSYNPVTGAITATGGSYSYNTTTHVLTLNTSQGGVFVVDMDNGDYTYQANSTMTSPYADVISVTLRDNDGDTATGTLTLNVARAQGGDGNDTITGTSAADLIIGSGGSDTMTGGAGADTFRWVLGDAEGSPTDRITDFSTAPAASGGDVLDLRDMLVGEAHVGTDAGNLASYLHFNFSGGNTTISVTTNDSANTTQSIVLQNVDLTANNSLSDQAIIQNLLSANKLIVD